MTTGSGESRLEQLEKENRLAFNGKGLPALRRDSARPCKTIYYAPDRPDYKTPGFPEGKKTTPCILYLDDEPELLEITKTYLEFDSEFKIETVQTFEEARQKMTFGVYDAIISDYEMPGMNGIDFLKYIRMNYDDLPFILFTGRGREEVVIDAINNGADFYIQKGGEPRSQFAELKHKIQIIVSKREMKIHILESRQRMTDIIDHLPDATFAVDNIGNVITWNKAIQEMTGIASEIILGKGNYEYALPFYGERKPLLLNLILNENFDERDRYTSFSQTGNRLSAEVFIPSFKNATGCHLQITASPLYDRNNNISGAIESIRDITELRKIEEILKRRNEELFSAYEQLAAIEEELRQNYDELHNSQQQLRLSEERYRDIVEDQTEFICRFRPDGTITFVNGAYCRYFGLDKDSCIGSHQIINIPPGDAEQIKQHLSSLTHENPVAVIEHRIVMPDGEIRWQQWSDRAIFDNDGNIVEYQSVGRDTTDRIIAEEKLKRTNTELLSAYEQLATVEKELRQSEERYRDLVEFLPLTVFELDETGLVTAANERAFELFGFTNEDLKEGINGFQMLIPEDRSRAIKNMQRVVSREKIVSSEYTVVRTDGRTIPVVFDSNVIIQDNKPAGIRCVMFDITVLKQVEEALRESEEKFRALVETSPDIIWEIDMQGNFSYLSPKIRTITGHEPGELIGRPMTNLILEELRSFFMEELLRHVATERTIPPYEVPVCHRDGHILFIEIRPIRVFSADGTPIGFRGVAHDITGRKRADEALRDSEKKFRILADMSPVAIVVFQDERIVYANDYTFLLMGYDKDEIYTMNIWDLFHPDFRGNIQEIIHTWHCGGNTPTRLEIKSVSKSGQEKWVSLSTRTIMYEGKPSGIATLTDITERKIAEEVLRQVNKKLIMLNNITRHDILNQIMALLVYIDLFKEATMDPQFLKYIEYEEQIVKNIQDQIEFTRNYQDVGMHEPKWQVLGELINSATRQLNPQGIEINVSVSYGEIFADILVEKVFFNLMENSIRHGEYVSRIHFFMQETDDGKTLVYEDNGIGITPEDKINLFQKGFGKHTGLGLFLSKLILSITGITITENGKPGKGVRFEITMPKGTYRQGTL